MKSKGENMLGRTLLTLAALSVFNGNLYASETSDSEDMQALTILTRNCAGCHQAADHPGALFLNKASLSDQATLALITKLVEKSQMPPAHKNFKNTPDGKTLIRWLKSKASKA